MREFKIKVGKVGYEAVSGVLKLDTETNCGVIEFSVTRKKDSKVTHLKHRPGVSGIKWNKSANHPVDSKGYYQNYWEEADGDAHVDDMEFVIETEVVLSTEF